ncbi:hypothetical protein GY45DRAFT_1373455 [Cubamyces sp. BRFM 1775]|nr:hypothetical protein GY45DRAFT_1373455 [Cubamyces sp. BRFM 1775]
MATTPPSPSTSSTSPGTSLAPRRAGGQSAVLIRPPAFSIFLDYQPSMLGNVVAVATDDEDDAEPRATLGTVADANNGSSPAHITDDIPESGLPVGIDPTHAITRTDKENILRTAVVHVAVRPRRATPASPQQSTPTVVMRHMRPPRPIVPLQKYRTAYKRFLFSEDLASSRRHISQRLNNRVTRIESETASNLFKGIKRKWKPTTAEFVPNKRPKTVAGRGTPGERPDGESFGERSTYEVPKDISSFRVPQWGATNPVRAPSDVLRLHSMALKREMPKKGKKDANGRTRRELSTADLLTTEVNLRWQFEAMEVDSGSDEAEPEEGDAGLGASVAPAGAPEDTSAINPLDAACVEDTGRLLPVAEFEYKVLDAVVPDVWDTMDYRHTSVITD